MQKMRFFDQENQFGRPGNIFLPQVPEELSIFSALLYNILVLWYHIFNTFLPP